MGTAAPQRKPAGSSRIPAEITQGGFAATPHLFFKRLFRCLEPVEYNVLGNILDETVGAVGFPTHARIAHKQFAEWAGVTIDAIDKALRALKEKGLIDAIKQEDRSVMYRARVENFEKVEERPRLKKPREEQEEADPKPAGVPVLLAPKGRPVRVNLGDTAAYFSNRGAQPLEIEHSERGGSFHFFIQLAKSDNTAVLSNRPQAPGRGEAAKSVPPPEISPPIEDLADALRPIFQGLYHQIPDFGLLSDIAHSLGSAPVSYYMGRVHAKLKTGYKARPGLFLNLAKDAGASWRELPMEAQRQWLPADVEAPIQPLRRVAEPEDSGSIWSKIRAFLKKLLPPNVFSNWFLHTAQVRADKDTLLVEAQDQTTVDFLEQEYGDQIRHAIRQLGLTVKHISYTVPFEEEKERV